MGFGLLILIRILCPCLIGSNLFFSEQMVLDASLTSTSVKYLKSLSMNFKLRNEVDTSGTNRTASSSSQGNVSFSGAILDLMNIRLVSA